MTLQNLRLQLHERILQYRCIHRLINSSNFENIFPHLSDSERQIVDSYIKNSDRSSLESFIKKKMREVCELEVLPVIVLREKARILGIKGWQYLSKPLLLSELYNARSNEVTS